MKLLILDIELNKTGDENEGGETTDIIQIGAVIYDSNKKEILPEKYNAYVHHYDPRGRLSHFIVKLTGITDEKLKLQGVDLITAVEGLYLFANQNNVTRVGQWGGGDIEAIEEQYNNLCLNYQSKDISLGSKHSTRKSLLVHNGTHIKYILPIPSPFKGSPINIKHIFQVYAISFDITYRGGLAKSLSRLDMEFLGDEHNALDDAYNTALIFNRIVNQREVLYKQLVNEMSGETITSKGLTNCLTEDKIRKVLRIK